MDILDELGEIIGKIEDILHHPLYPIKEYTFEVSDELIRGSWPNRKMLDTLKESGCTTIINLCAERKQDELVQDCGLKSLNIPIVDNTVPTEDNIHNLLLALSTEKCYLHCEEGKGRTGCMVAAYRVRHDAWETQEALKEAMKFGLELENQKEFILRL